MTRGEPYDDQGGPGVNLYIIIFNEESFVTYDVIFTKVLHIGNIIYTNNHAIYKNLKLVKSQKSKTVSHDVNLIALTAAEFFDWGGGEGLANAEGVSLLGLGVPGNFEI